MNAGIGASIASYVACCFLGALVGASVVIRKLAASFTAMQEYNEEILAGARVVCEDNRRLRVRIKETESADKGQQCLNEIERINTKIRTMKQFSNNQEES